MEKIPTAKAELHKLVSKTESESESPPTPVLILANKIDKVPHLGEASLIEQMGLDEIQKTPWIVMPISALECVGIDTVIEWLIDQST